MAPELRPATTRSRLAERSSDNTPSPSPPDEAPGTVATAKEWSLAKPVGERSSSRSERLSDSGQKVTGRRLSAESPLSVPRQSVHRPSKEPLSR